jgi:hypothetical protein
MSERSLRSLPPLTSLFSSHLKLSRVSPYHLLLYNISTLAGYKNMCNKGQIISRVPHGYGTGQAE